MADTSSLATATATAQAQPPPGIKYPHITIQYCTQCKWMLRAAYFAQELLSTFSTTPIPPVPTTTATTTPQPQQFTLPSITLLPSTGGLFTVTLYHTNPEIPHIVQEKVLWDRKTEGGFPEVKELKRRVRDVIDPGRGLGHVDRAGGKKAGEGEKKEVVVAVAGEGEKEGEEGKKKESCIDCR